MNIGNLVNIFFLLLSLSLAAGCNVAPEETVENSRSTANDSSSETFIYSDSELEVVQSITSVNIYPINTFDSPSYSILPSLPSGMRINSGTGVISGIPSSSLVKTLYIIKAVHFDGIDYAQLNLTVSSEPPISIYYDYGNLDFNKGALASYPLTVLGGTPTAYSVTPALPIGLFIDSTDGKILGTPTNSGNGFYTVTASNAAGSASVVVLINIADSAPLTLGYTNGGQTVNTYGLFTTMSPTLANIPDSVSYRITPNLPSGLTLDTSTGTVSGIPLENNGVTAYTVTAYNPVGESSSAISITIQDPARSITYPVSTIELQQNVTMTAIPIDTYLGGRPVTYACVGCPTGISVNLNTGLVSGTATGVVGTGTLSIQATDTPTTTTVSYNITYKIVEDYPVSTAQMGFASTYTFYVGSAVSTFPAVIAGGMPTSYKLVDESYGINSAGPPVLYNTPITGLTFNYTTGQILGTPTGAAEATIVIEGYNLDETSTAVKRAEQTITIKVEVLAPQALGYLATPPAEYNLTTSIIELTEGIPLVAPIAPSISGGAPTLYTVIPKLPDGLSLSPITGIITGNPRESVPVKYYSITGSNDAGSYTESLAISTSTLSAPVSIVYPGVNNLTFTLFTYQEETPVYIGSQATFNISPTLPAGLYLNHSSGLIYGSPIAAYAGAVAYNVTITNSLGVITQAVNISITNINPANLKYTSKLSQLTAVFFEGNVVAPNDTIHTSDFDPNNPLTSSGFIETYTDISAGAVTLATLGLSLNTTGDIVGTAVPGFPRESSITYMNAQHTTNPHIIQGTGNSVNINNSADSFRILVLENPPVISYASSYGSNVLVVQGSQASTTSGGENDTDSKYYNSANSGGFVSSLTSNAASNNCTVAETSSINSSAFNIAEEYVDYYNDTQPYTITSSVYTATNFTFEGTNCSFRFNANTCFGAGDSKTYAVTAKNSGTWDFAGGTNPGVTTNVTVHYYDGPNYVYQPDGSGLDTDYVLYGKKHLTLDGNNGSYSPYTTNLCHNGDYDLSDINDLPTPLTFNTSTGQIDTNAQVLMGKRSFTISAKESISGLDLTQSDAISVQANHLETNAGVAAHSFDTVVFDFNADGAKDILIRSQLCDGLACNNNTTTVFIQDTLVAGKFDGVGIASPVITATGKFRAAGLKYGVSKAAIAFIELDGAGNANTISVYSATTGTEFINSTNEVNTSLTLSSDGYGIVPMEVSVVSNFGVVIDNGTTSLTIDQFTILGGILGDATPAVTPTTGLIDSVSNATITVANDAAGGVNLGVIQLVKYDDTDGDGFNDAVIAYLDNNTVDRKICVLKSNGTDFATSCNPRIDVPNDGDVKDIKFADINGDSLNEMVILSNVGGASNTVYVFENKNNTFAGLYQNTDLINLSSGSTFVDFSLADVNSDGLVDIVANDTVSDLDADGTPETLVSSTGYSIYFHSGLSDIYQQNIKASDDDAFFYMNSTGDTNLVELIPAGGSQLLFHCSIDIDNASATTNGTTLLSSYQNSGCGVVGSF